MMPEPTHKNKVVVFKEVDKSAFLERIAGEVLYKFTRVGGNYMTGGGFVLEVGWTFINRRSIGSVYIFPNQVDVYLTDTKYAAEIKKLCDKIKKKTKSTVTLTVTKRKD